MTSPCPTSLDLPALFCSALITNQPKAPVMFSWGRQKKPAKIADDEDKDEAPVPEVFSAAPFGVFPTGSSAAPAWKTESKAKYTPEALVEVPEPVAVTLSCEAPAKEEEASVAKTPKSHSKRFETESSLNFLWPSSAGPAASAARTGKTQISYSNEESASMLPAPPKVVPDGVEMANQIPNQGQTFVSEMAGRFLKFELDESTPASTAVLHKNASDPYLLHHHYVTLPQIFQSAADELEAEGFFDGAEETKGDEEAEEKEEAEEEKEDEKVEEEQKGEEIDPIPVQEPYSTEPLPPSVNIAPDTPVAVKKKTSPSFRPRRGEIVNMNPSRKRRQNEANAKAARASRASRALTRKYVAKDKQAGNPVLRNKRYPNSDGGAKWHTENSAQYQYKYIPPVKPFKFD